MILAVVLIINGLITVLMMKSFLTKERGEIALLKSMGFSNRAVRGYHTSRILILLLTSIIVGTILSNILAPVVGGPIFGMMGASHVKMVTNPLLAYLIFPLILLSVTGLSAILCSAEVNGVDVKEVNNIE